MKKTFWGGLLAALLFGSTAFASVCVRQNPPLADGDVLYAANYEGELNNLISCDNANLQKIGGTLTGDLTLNGGNLWIWAGEKLGIYSDSGVTSKFSVDGANGNTIIGGNLTVTGSTSLTSPTITNPSITGTVSGGATYTSPTLTIPTIASFTNAQHNHQNAAGGGTLDVAAISTGTLPVARGGTGVTTSTGSGNVVLSNSPTIVTPAIASFTNAQHNHQNAAGGGTLNASAIAAGTLPVARGGTGVTTSTGSTNVVLSNSPTLSGTVGGSLTWSGTHHFNNTITTDGDITFTGNGGPGTNAVIGNGHGNSGTTDGDILFDPQASTEFVMSSALNSFYPVVSNSDNLGISSKVWKELFIQGQASPSANALNSNSGVRAWGFFNAAGVLQAGYNINGAATTNPSAGSYVVTFITPFASPTLWVPIVSITDTTPYFGISSFQSSASTCSVRTYNNSANTNTNAPFSLIVFGTQ